jgi:tetratricopeptide (TPR) repeat protein
LPSALLCLIAALHARTLGFGFLAWDDPLHVTANPLVISPTSVPWFEHWTTPALGYPVPVTVLSYALQAGSGLQPAWAFHLVNIALHLAVCGLVFLLARRMGLSLMAAALACLLVGLHPVVAEPVSWVSGRKDLLAALFGLLALWFAWPEAPERTAAARGLRIAAAIGCFTLGLLSKPSIAGLCVLLPLAQLWFARDRARPAARGNAAALAIGCTLVLLPVVYVALTGQRAVGALIDSERGGASYARAFWYALGHHLDLLFLWRETSVKYVPAPWPPGFTPSVDLAPLLAAALAGASAIFPREPRRVALFAVAWAVAGYLPSSNLVPIARYLADSYLYFPLIGCAFWLGAAADGVASVWPADRRRLLWLAPALLTLTLAPLLWTSSARYQNDETLWAQALSLYPNSAHICRQWANGVNLVRGPAPALVATDHCIERFGPSLFVKNRGILLAQTGRSVEAQRWLRRAQLANPEDRSLQRYLDALSALRAARAAPAAGGSASEGL